MIKCASIGNRSLFAAKPKNSQKKKYTKEKGDCCEKKYLFSIGCGFGC